MISANLFEFFADFFTINCLSILCINMCIINEKININDNAILVTKISVYAGA